MSAELPTEEDVLAMAVLCAIVNADDAPREWALESALMAFGDDPPELAERIRPTGVLEIARTRRAFAGSWSAAIADSERRLEVERAQTEVIRAAYFLAAAPGDSQARLRESVYRMNCARREAGMETLP